MNCGGEGSWILYLKNGTIDCGLRLGITRVVPLDVTDHADYFNWRGIVIVSFVVKRKRTSNWVLSAEVAFHKGRIDHGDWLRGWSVAHFNFAPAKQWNPQCLRVPWSSEKVLDGCVLSILRRVTGNLDTARSVTATQRRVSCQRHGMDLRQSTQTID